MMNERAKYHLVITDNETGKVLRDINAYAIIGGATLEDDSTDSFRITNCNALQLCATLLGAQDAIDDLYAEHPELGPLCAFVKKASEDDEAEE